jgi:hypothetical protein
MFQRNANGNLRVRPGCPTSFKPISGVFCPFLLWRAGVTFAIVGRISLRTFCTPFVLCCFFLPAGAWGATYNAWTNSTSGNWEDLRWSLGIRPGEGQTISIENAGWKAVAIGPNTRQNFPETLTVADIRVSAPADSFNLLLLNYAGFEPPLATGNVFVGPYGAITALASMLDVSTNLGTGEILVSGTFNQGESAMVTPKNITLGNPYGPGLYNLTNGVLSADAALLTSSNSTFNQFGGLATINSLRLNKGRYNVFGGALEAAALDLAGGDFNQAGGSVTGVLHIAVGTYSLSGGILQLPALSIPNTLGSGIIFLNATVLQTGGTNLCDYLSVHHEYGATGIPQNGPGRYVLSNGVLKVSNYTRSDGGGNFQQWGGLHTNAETRVTGYDDGRHGPRLGGFTLGGGILLTPSISINFGGLLQSGGTNRVSGNVVVGTQGQLSSFRLTGGLLTDLNAGIFSGSGSGSGSYQSAVFIQTGGSHIVTNLLSISGYNRWNMNGYILSGGQLSAPNIRLENGGIFYHDGGTLTHSGLLTLGAGTWNEQSGGQQFGQLLLNSPPGSNATISLPPGSCQIRFANSSSVAWSNQAALVIDGWKGAANGGGMHQIIFGANASALTPQQLTQIQFRNPGDASGIFPARILASGEVVPARFLAARRTSTNLVLEWSSGTLQSATNVTGPFQDMPVTSPYTNSFSGPQRFFRIKN